MIRYVHFHTRSLSLSLSLSLLIPQGRIIPVLTAHAQLTILCREHQIQQVLDKGQQEEKSVRVSECVKWVSVWLSRLCLRMRSQRARITDTYTSWQRGRITERRTSSSQRVTESTYHRETLSYLSSPWWDLSKQMQASFQNESATCLPQPLSISIHTHTHIDARIDVVCIDTWRHRAFDVIVHVTCRNG